MKNHNLVIYGDGSQTRSFCYIDDLLIVLEKIMESNFQDLSMLDQILRYRY